MRSSAPRLRARSAAPRSPRARAAAGSSSQAPKTVPSSAGLATRRQAAARSNSAAISRKFSIAGPAAIGTAKRAGSSGLWPPLGTSVPPTNAAAATR